MHNQTVDIDTIFFLLTVKPYTWPKMASSKRHTRLLRRKRAFHFKMRSNAIACRISPFFSSKLWLHSQWMSSTSFASASSQTISIFFKINSMFRLLIQKYCHHVWRFVSYVSYDLNRFYIYTTKSVNPLIRMWYYDIHPSFLGKHAAIFCYPLYPCIILFLWNVSFYPRQINFAF